MCGLTGPISDRTVPLERTHIQTQMSRHDRRNNDRRNDRRNDNYREPPRAPYDVSQEQVMLDVGAFDYNRFSQVKVRITRYQGVQEPRVLVVRTGTNREGESYETGNVGRLNSTQLAQLVTMLQTAQQLIAENRVPFAQSDESPSSSNPRRTRGSRDDRRDDDYRFAD